MQFDAALSMRAGDFTAGRASACMLDMITDKQHSLNDIDAALLERLVMACSFLIIHLPPREHVKHTAFAKSLHKLRNKLLKIQQSTDAKVARLHWDEVQRALGFHMAASEAFDHVLTKFAQHSARLEQGWIATLQQAHQAVPAALYDRPTPTHPELYATVEELYTVVRADLAVSVLSAADEEAVTAIEKRNYDTIDRPPIRDVLSLRTRQIHMRSTFQPSTAGSWSLMPVAAGVLHRARAYGGHGGEFLDALAELARVSWYSKFYQMACVLYDSAQAEIFASSVWA